MDSGHRTLDVDVGLRRQDKSQPAASLEETIGERGPHL
jgi:hypothetical protein